MAVRFATVDDRYTSGSGLPAGTAWTALCWVYLSADRNTYSNAFAISDGTNYLSAGFGANGTVRYVGWEGGDLNANAGTTDSPVDAWTRLAVVCNGTTVTLYWGDATGPILSRSATGIPPATPNILYLGSDQWDSWLDGRVAGFKLYEAVLTAAEIEQELAQYQPVRTQNLLRSPPLLIGTTTDSVGALVDLSGRAQPLTAGPADTVTEDGPPLRWGRARSPRVTITAAAPAVEFSGAGSLTTTGAADRPAVAAFAGQGALTVAATRQRPAAATFAGAGALTAGAFQTRSAAAAFAGEGSLSAVSGAAATATFTGAGTLTAGVQQTRGTAAALAGAGQLTVTGSTHQHAATAFTGAGALAVGVTRRQPISALLSGAGAMTVFADRVRLGAAAFTGAGSMQIATTRSATGTTFTAALYAIDKTTGALTPLPAWTKLSLSPVRNDMGAISVQYPAGAPGFELLDGGVGADPPRVLEVEIRLSGSAAGARRGWLVQKRTSNKLLPAGIVQIDGHFEEWLLAKALVDEQTKTAANPKGELIFSSATYGEMLLTVVNQAQARGALPGVTVDFTTTHDSNGVAWDGEVSNLKIPPKSTVLQVADKGVELELGEFYMTPARVLRAFNAGTRGVDRTGGGTPLEFTHAVNLAGHGRAENARDAGAAVLAAGGEGNYAWATNGTALASLGFRAEVAADAGNLTSEAAVLAFAQGQAQVLGRGLAEYQSQIEIRQGDRRPLLDYDVADWAVARTWSERKSLRIAQISVEFQQGQSPKIVVAQNDLISDRTAALLRRLNRLASGDAVVGTSEPPTTEDTMAPAAPTGVVVDSSAYYGDRGDALATLEVGWTPVTTNADNTPTSDVSGYRVQWRPTAAPATAWQQGADEPGQGGSTAFGDAPAGTDVLVRVAAYDYNGNTSEWSDVVEITTVTNTTPPPVPSTPVAHDGRLGVVELYWDGLGSAGEGMPARFDYVEVHHSAAAVFEPTEATYYDRLYARGTMPIVGLTYGQARYFRLVAVDRTMPTPNKSGPSGTATATPEKLIADDVFAGAIGSAALANLAVKTANIDNGAVNDLQVGNLSVGKLTAGVFSAAMTLTGIIRTGNSGLHWEGDPAGIRFYNASDQLTIRLEGASGNSLLTGTTQTALTGARLVLESTGTMRLYPAVGTNYNLLYNAGTNGLIFRSGLDGNNRAGFLYLQSSSAQLSYGTPGTLVQNTRLQCSLNATEMWAPILAFRVDRRFPTDGTSYRAFFSNFGNSGDDPDTVLWYQDNGNAEPWWFAPGKNVALTFSGTGVGDGSLFVSTGQGNPAALTASAVNEVSTIAWKENVDDARATLDPLATIDDARSRSWNYIWELTYTPPATEEDPNPAPVPVENPPVRFGPIAEELPAALVESVPGPNGTRVPGVNLGSLIGVMWGALGQIQDQEIRSVAGRVALPDGAYLPDATIELPVEWDEEPLEVPTGGVVTVYAAIAWLGKTTAKIKPGSITATGCTVVVRVLDTVAPSASSPITVEAQALYLWTPPYQPEN